MAVLGLPISRDVIGAAIAVHRRLGPGLYESVYERCLAYELEKVPFSIRRQVRLPLVYDVIAIDCAYRVDMVVADQLVVELKCVERILPIHGAQARTYLRLSGYHQALLFNFNALRLKDGI